ncbi:MAG: dephospho-CoA kinase [Bacteroidales bacterium]|nr:dephospho-CoA kinase [Bacteroidales bacterium]
MKRVGITGGMGCGKTTVVEEFARLGVPAFVADKVGGSYYNEAPFLAEVRKLLGDEVFDADGRVDKKRIAERVFSDKETLANLNALVHPRVMADFDLFCEQHADKPYVLFESAILYDYGLERFMDKVICVYLSLDERLARLKERDHADDSELLARIHNQMPAEEMMRRADYVILNYEGNPRRRQVAYIDKQLRIKN